MRILVTGAGGFVGKHLVAELMSRGHEVFASVRQGDLELNRCAELVFVDLTDENRVKQIILQLKPDGIIHLAAQSMVKIAWENPSKTVMVNTVATINLIEAVNRHSPTTKIINVGSSEEYGLTAKTGYRLTEEQPCLPQNPYASSKLATGQIAIQLAKKHQLNIIHVRPFNHFGPGQQEGFVVSDFASQIAKIEEEILPPVIKVGDLRAKRDFTDVRDVVNAYVKLMENNVSTGVFNICSGVPRAVKDILSFLLENAKLPIEVQMDRQRFRPSDVPIFIGSAANIKKAINWVPKRNFEESLLETIDWWRMELKNKI